MIIVDFSQIIISHIFQQKQNVIEEGFLRHLVLTSLLFYKNKFSKDYGDLVLACDGKASWRKQYFPLYKANRKIQREKTSTQFDWNTFFKSFDKIKLELRTMFPYKIIEVDEAEGDDVIAVLVNKYKTDNNIIISSDKDLKQLKLCCPHIKQFSPLTKKFISCDNAEEFLLEHIIRGDTSDGIPNVLSDDDTFVNPYKRQKQIRETKFNEIVEAFNFNKNLYPKLSRNQVLIDLREIPKFIVAKIDQYDEIENDRLIEYNKNNDKKNLINYFMEYEMVHLFNRLQEF
jgi:hypothetical protein